MPFVFRPVVREQAVTSEKLYQSRMVRRNGQSSVLPFRQAGEKLFVEYRKGHYIKLVWEGPCGKPLFVRDYRLGMSLYVVFGGPKRIKSGRTRPDEYHLHCWSSDEGASVQLYDAFERPCPPKNAEKSELIFDVLFQAIELEAMHVRAEDLTPDTPKPP
jgi:hypothetical protein